MEQNTFKPVRVWCSLQHSSFIRSSGCSALWNICPQTFCWSHLRSAAGLDLEIQLLHFFVSHKNQSFTAPRRVSPKRISLEAELFFLSSSCFFSPERRRKELFLLHLFLRIHPRPGPPPRLTLTRDARALTVGRVGSGGAARGLRLSTSGEQSFLTARPEFVLLPRSSSSSPPPPLPPPSSSASLSSARQRNTRES